MEITVYASIEPIEIQEKQKGRTPASFHFNNLVAPKCGKSLQTSPTNALRYYELISSNSFFF